MYFLTDIILTYNDTYYYTHINEISVYISVYVI